jgi:parvulin-like peptidyl-prolyl isomerase
MDSMQMPNSAPETSGAETKSQTTKSKRMFLYGIGAVALIALLGGVMLGFRATKNLADDANTLRFAKVFGVAAAKVNGMSIPYNEYITELNVLRKVYSKAPEGVQKPTEEKMSDDVLGNLIINSIISSEAKKYSVSLAANDIESSDAYKGMLERFGGDKTAAEKQIMDTFGISFNDYLEKAIRPVLLEQKLREKFETTENADKAYDEEQVRASHILIPVTNFDDAKAVATAKKTAQSVLDRAKKGEDFATLAKEFGTDGTKDKGGDLDWFGKGRMVKEFEDAVWALPAGTLDPELVKTQFGFHIVKVTDRRTGHNYTKFMADKIRNAVVEILLPIHNPFTDIKSQLDAQAGAAAELNSKK